MQDIIDIGCNLAHDSFDDDRAAVIERAANAGVTRLVVTGTSVTTSVQALALTDRHPGRLFATAGIHPHHATTVDEHGIAALRQLVASSSVVAVGECGLDFFRDFSPRDAQRNAFEAQLDLASAVGKPVFLHQRDAHAEFVAASRTVALTVRAAVLRTASRAAPTSCARISSLDLYIGVTGWVCDERRGDALRTALQKIPLESSADRDRRAVPAPARSAGQTASATQRAGIPTPRARGVSPLKLASRPIRSRRRATEEMPSGSSGASRSRRSASESSGALRSPPAASRTSPGPNAARTRPCRRSRSARSGLR